jgi:amino acid adenylation domain-containing protein
MALLHAHVSRHAVLRPRADAVTDGTQRLDYAQLESWSRVIATQLEAAGVAPGDAVLVCMKRSVRTLVALIAVLRAGATAVPLEVRTPAARRDWIVGDCCPVAVLCDPANAQQLIDDERLRQHGATVLAVEGGPPTGMAPERSPLPCSEDALAYLLYTSGSTGRPKGVMLSHRNIDAYAAWAVERVGIGADDRVLCTAPLYFDMSLFDVFCALRAGATLCIATERVLMFPKKLMAFGEEERVTVWKGVSSLLTYLSRTGALAPQRLPTLRTVLFGGEELPAKYLRDWMATFPDKAFYNFFGPTEGTGASLYHRVHSPPQGDDERVPIGIPRENTDLYLLDERRCPVPEGEVGEICLAGVCVAQGYLNDPERTARSFFDDPWRPGQRAYLTGDLAFRRPDGCYHFVGRKDNQVKFMGYRLELGDIEAALTAIAGVAEAGALVAASRLAGVDELVAYVVLEGPLSALEVRKALEGSLPYYMLPKRILPIDRLPRSERGKLDRRALLDHHLAGSDAG